MAIPHQHSLYSDVVVVTTRAIIGHKRLTHFVFSTKKK